MKAFLTILFISFMLCCYAQETIPEKMKISRKKLIEKTEQYIIHEVNRRKIVGLSVAIVDEEGVVMSEGFGYANKENKKVL